MNLNKAFILGNVTRDPENRALPSGKSVTSFGIATNRFYTDRNGEKKQDAEFHNVTAFGRLADISAQYLKKGSLVLIEGRIRTSSWQDASGNRRYRTEIIAENLQLGPRGVGRISQAPPESRTSQQEEIPIIEENVYPKATETKERPEPKLTSASQETEKPKENPAPSPADQPEEEIRVEDIPF